MRPCDPWWWHNPGRVVTGRSWGGNLAIVSWLLMADKAVRPVEEYAGQVLILETSEELPSDEEVYRVLRCMGERGLLRQFSALLFAKPKTWALDRPTTPEESAAYRAAQRAAVLRALDEYAPEMMAVFDVDFGHTDPQLVIPYGGSIRVDGVAERIFVTY
nr:hypothetical protein [Amycolatopsis umgeniensis]